MKKALEIKEIYRNKEAYSNKEIVINGWIRTNRSSNKFGFIELNDGSFFKSVQVVYEQEVIANLNKLQKHLLQEH